MLCYFYKINCGFIFLNFIFRKLYIDKKLFIVAAFEFLEIDSSRFIFVIFIATLLYYYIRRFNYGKFN